MGNFLAIRVHPDQPSKFIEGETSIWTDPIGEDLVDDVDEFFAELIQVSRDPVTYLAMEHCVVKDIETTELGPDNFRVRKILDGVKLKKLFPARENEDDICTACYESKADRTQRYLRTVAFNPETGTEEVMQLHTVLHPNPEENNFRAEVWAFDKEGKRRSGPVIAGMVEWVFMKPLVASRIGQKVKVRGDVDVPDSGGKSVMTESLDEFYTADGAFEAIVTMLKQEAIDGNAPISYKSDMEFDVNFETEFPIPEELQNKETDKKTVRIWAARNVVTDPKGRSMCTQDHCFDELVSSTFYRVHEDPVRLEYWEVTPAGLRVSGAWQAIVIRLRLMKLLSEQEVKAQLEALKDDQNNFMF